MLQLFIYDSLFTYESNFIKLTENKDNFNKGINSLTTKTSKEELNSNFPFNNNDRKLMEYINSVCSEMFSPWVAKLLMDVFILTQHHEGYDVIKHANQYCLHRVYFNPQKYPITNQFQGDVYDLLCKDLATSAI